MRDVVIFGLMPMTLDADSRDRMHAPGLARDAGTVHART
jgi:hypothetical protein